jgi:hypothetical protein
VPALDLWCGRAVRSRSAGLIATALVLGHAIGFANCRFRVGWVNGLLALQMG